MKENCMSMPSVDEDQEEEQHAHLDQDEWYGERFETREGKSNVQCPPEHKWKENPSTAEERDTLHGIEGRLLGTLKQAEGRETQMR